MNESGRLDRDSGELRAETLSTRGGHRSALLEYCHEGMLTQCGQRS